MKEPLKYRIYIKKIGADYHLMVDFFELKELNVYMIDEDYKHLRRQYMYLLLVGSETLANFLEESVLDRAYKGTKKIALLRKMIIERTYPK